MSADVTEPRQRADGHWVAAELDHAVPPGETLRERLGELGMSQAELAVRTGLTPKHINQLLQGIVPLSTDVARRLEFAVGVPATWWNRLQADYQSVRARIESDEGAARHQAWVAAMPVRQLVRLGAVPAEPKDTASRLRQLLAFFGVASPEAFDQTQARLAVAFHQSEAYRVHDGAVAAWLRLGELAASQAVPQGTYGAAGLRRLLPLLRGLTTQPLTVSFRALRDLLASAGVTLVLVPEIEGARAYGATRWLAGRPVIQLSLRGGTEDAFWFTLFHELAHVLLHGKRDVFIEFDDQPSCDALSASASDRHSEGAGSAASTVQASEREREAHAFAHDTLFGLGHRDVLRVLDEVTDAADFAERLGIGTGLVVHRLHQLGFWEFSKGAATRLKLPSAETLTTASVVRVRSRPVRRARSAIEDAGPAAIPHFQGEPDE